MPRKNTNFSPGAYYYLCNIGNTGEPIFDGPGNHQYFKNLLIDRTESVLEVLAWCLIHNQYHLIVRVKSAYRLRKQIERSSKGEIKKVRKGEYSRFISERIGAMLGSYAKAYNKMYSRKGSLFRESFTKIELKTSDEVTLFMKAVLSLEGVVKERDNRNQISAVMTGLSTAYEREEMEEWEEKSMLEILDEQKVKVRSCAGRSWLLTRSAQLLEEVEEEIGFQGVDIDGMMKQGGERAKKLFEIVGWKGERYWEKMMEMRVRTLAKKLIRK